MLQSPKALRSVSEQGSFWAAFAVLIASIGYAVGC